MTLRPLLGIVVLVACGGPSTTVGDAGSDMRGGAGAGKVDAGRPPPPPFDAGPPPPQTVFGSVAVNDTTMMLSTGYGTTATRLLTLKLGTSQAVVPYVLVGLSLPSDAGAGYATTCANPSVLFSAQYSTDAGLAYFTLNPTCSVTLSQVASSADGGEYQGTFSGTVDWDSRSVLDAGFGTLKLTNGTFRVKRTF